MGIVLAGGMCLKAGAQGTPRIQFDQTIYDFGKTSVVTSVSGSFKFQNTGDGVLKLEPPKPSCGCTVAEVKPDTLPPGATGELPFSLNLGYYRGNLQKHITVKSNDPKTPEVSLSIKVDYTPLYELTPMTLSPNLAFGMDETNLFTTLARTDGKPLQITKLEASEPWIIATLVPGVSKDDTTARIQISIKRDGPPAASMNLSMFIPPDSPMLRPPASIFMAKSRARFQSHPKPFTGASWTRRKRSRSVRLILSPNM